MPRSDAIVRSPDAAIETTTPVRPATGPRCETPRRASSRRTSSPATSAPTRPTNVAVAPSDAAHAATFAAWPPGPVLVLAGWSSPGTSSRVEAYDDVEQEIAEGDDAHGVSRLVVWKATVVVRGCGRSRSAVSSARRACSRRHGVRRFAGRGAPAVRPGGLAAFEDAPCFLELIGEEAQRYRDGGETSAGTSNPT